MNLKDIPEGYIPGMDRSDRGNYKVTHLYKGTFSDPGLPMCINGWNRCKHTDYSIWRNNISDKGICKVCLSRAQQGLDGVQPMEYGCDDE